MKNYRQKAQKILVLVSFFFSTSTLFSQEYIVKYKDNKGFHKSFNSSFLHNPQFGLKASHEKGSLHLIQVTKENEKSLLKNLKNDSDIEYVVKNIKIELFPSTLTNDPKIGEQWALEKVKAKQAWKFTKGDPSIVVAVIDTGINWKHEDLRKQIWSNPNETPGNGVDDDNNGYVDDVRGWDFAGKDNDPEDETSSRNPGHGTHCAGIVGATGGNGIGISGMAQNVTLMPVRFLDANGSGDLMNAVKSIDYAIDNKADIISASWGAAVKREQMAPVLEAIERARNKGILFIAAAANDGKSNDFREVYPANAGFENVISVAASGPQDEKPSWSNFGRATVDLAAPGLNIYSTLPGKYGSLSGTSMATPLVSGLAALILSQAKKLGKTIHPTEVKALLQSTSDKVKIETASFGRVSAFKALKALTDDAFIMTPFAKTLAVGETLKISSFNGKGPFSFKSSDENIATASKDGLLTAKAEGQVSLMIKDSEGNQTKSDNFYIGKGKAPKNNCPFEQPQLCDIMCKMNPKMPWC